MENLPRHLVAVITGITLGLAVGWGLAEINVLAIPPNLFEPTLTMLSVITGILNFITFSHNKTLNTATLSNRDLLIQAVQNNWIDDGKGNGFLQDALRDATIQVDMEGKPDKAGDSGIYKDYDLPIELVLREGNQRDNIKHTSDILRTTFQHVEKKLLILGEAGTGKTVLLLQLTETLLQEARDSHAPIPVVFNLASWAEDRLSLTDWLKKRFKIDYGVSDKFATELIAGDSLIYCLDGFDEVAENYRADCLVELNTFMTPTRQVVICSRIKEFEALAQPLNTKYAIEIQILEDAQFKTLLEDNIPYPDTVTKILATLQTDDAVWQEIKKPLFANILINTYADGAPFPEHNIEGTTEQKVYTLIISRYIERQFQNKKITQKNFDNSLIPRYLAWIADNLHQRKQTVFYIEMLQGHWLPNEGLEKRFRWISMLSFRLDEIDLEKRVQFSLGLIYLGFKRNWFLGMFLGMFLGLFAGMFLGLFAGLIVGLIVGLFCWLIVGLIFGLFAELSGLNPISQRSKFNQGLNDTLIAGLIVGLIGGLSVGLFFGLIGGLGTGLIGGLIVGLRAGLRFWLIVGLFYWLFLGLRFGLGSIFKHTILRIILKNQKLAPRRYDRFLEHVIERRIMRRVGGSAVFIHRYVLEYFAEEWTQRYQSEFDE